MITKELLAPDLPREAAPFLRDFLFEIARRIPLALAPPFRLPPASLADSRGCSEAARALLVWLDGSQETLGRRIDELDSLFRSLLEALQQIDRRIHRAVHQTRRLVEEEMAFSHVVQEALGDLTQALQTEGSSHPAPEIIYRVMERLEANQRAERSEAMALSVQFDTAERDLNRLREQIARVDKEVQALRDQSLRDGLTGLWNRRAFEGRMADEVARAQRYFGPLSVAVWDVDGFNTLNETNGFEIGDRVLQALAERALSMLRRSDFLARYGDNLFAAIFTNTDGSQALTAAEKIRSSVERDPVRTVAGPIPVTVSIGVASWHPNDTPSAMIQAAGEALLHAKNSGRNRVEAARREVDDPAPAS